MTRIRFRNVCFTAWCKVEEIEYDRECMKYLCIGKEVCPESGREHLQGYVEYVQQKDFEKVKKDLGGDQTHLESRRGSAHQAATYCKKENDFVEFGTISKQGNRTDLDNVVEDIESGCNVREVALSNPVQFIKYHRGIEKLRALFVTPRNWITECNCLWGKTGTGKSRKAREMCNGEPYWVWTPQRGSWFDGYDGQDYVIFEEFRGQLPFGDILTLTDRYECPVQVKGGMVEFRPKTIIFTSPKHPKYWYHDMSNDKIDQLLRRVSNVSEVTG